MKFYTEPQKNIEITYEIDVLVIGSGPAGFSAALSAARNGAKTLIIEQLGNIGGISTEGLMSHWGGKSDGGIFHEILKKCAEINEGNNYDKITNVIDPEKLKTLYLNMLSNEKVKILLYTFASDVIMEGNKIVGVIVENKSGRQAIMAKAVIDASGDGDIAKKAGVKYILGREEDGKMQPATIMFKVAGVDVDHAVFLGSFESKYETEKGELQALAKQYIPFPAGHVLCYKSTLPSVVTINMTNCIDVDGTRAEDLTAATIVCRNQMEKIVEFLREFVPGFQNCYMISSASLVGIRETRHFCGEYTLTAEDIWEAKQFPDWVVTGALFNFDVHNISGAGLDKTGVQHKFTQNNGYSIPYGCLLPKGVDGLLLSGRNISGTHIAHSNFRVMPICSAIGEAAGVAAAISCRENVPLHEVAVSEIQACL